MRLELTWICILNDLQLIMGLYWGYRLFFFESFYLIPLYLSLIFYMFCHYVFVCVCVCVCVCVEVVLDFIKQLFFLYMSVTVCLGNFLVCACMVVWFEIYL